MIALQIAAAIASASMVASATPALATPTTPAAAAKTQQVKTGRCVKAFTHVYRGKRLVTGKFCGRHLSDKQIAAVLHRAGFRGQALTHGVATVLAESNGWDQTVRYNRNAAGTIISVDHGLWQINDKWHPEITKIRPGDSLAASRLARTIARRYGLDTWHGYKNRGQFQKRANAAARAVS